MIVTGILLTMAMSSQGPVVACTGTAKVVLTLELTAPDPGMTSVVLGTLGGAPALTPLVVSAGKAALSKEMLATWQSLAKAISPPVLLWTKADKSVCAQDIQLDAAVTPAAPETSTDPGLGGAVRKATGECAVDGTAWLADLERSDPRRHKTVVVFNGANTCYRTDARRPAVHGDPIYVGVLTENATAWSNAAVAFTPCDIESAVPQVQSSGEFPGSLRQSGAWVLLTALPRSCWNDSVTIAIKGADPKAQAGYVLPQYGRYRATMHLGMVFTDQHEVTYGLQTRGAQKFIVNKGPVEKGPEYVASVVFYSVLRYIPPLWTGNAYKGREIRNEQGFVDRLGFSVGVGITDPTERLTYGFTFELFSGVNLFGGWDRAVLNVLPEGLEENQPFVGEESDIEVRQMWETKKVVGLTFDLAYVAKLFK